jgi:hypothetical protein
VLLDVLLVTVLRYLPDGHGLQHVSRSTSCSQGLPAHLIDPGLFTRPSSPLGAQKLSESLILSQVMGGLAGLQHLSASADEVQSL